MDINDGTNQNRRADFILEDDFLEIDDLAFPELVSFTSNFAKKVKYYNTQNIPDGNWNELLYNDDIVVISEIITFDIRKIENDFVDIERANFVSITEFAQKKTELILRLVLVLDSWYVRLKKNDNFSNKGLFKFTDELIRTKLLAEFNGFKDFISHHEIPNDLNTEILNPIWNSTESEKSPIYAGKGINIGLFSRIFFSFYNAINYLKQSVDCFLDESFSAQEHAPHNALLFTFIKLLIKVKLPLNRIPQKYFDFYYNEILKLKPRSFQSDSTYLLLSLKEGFNDFFIPKGTLFVAGKDENGATLYYETSKDNVINQAEIVSLYTLYADFNPQIWPKTKCSGFYSDEIVCETIDNIKLDNLNKKPLFGSMYGGTKKFADIGFIISDNNLMLCEGDRKVEVSIVFSEDSFKQFISQLDALKGDYDFEEILIKMMDNMFSISATGPDEWWKIESYTCECYLMNKEIEPYSLTFQFHLSIEDKAIIGYDKNIHGYNLNHNIPSLRFLLSNDSYLFPYSLIQSLEVEKISTTVLVENLKNNVVYNELGRIDTSKSFYPFGIIPQVNSAVIVGNYEMSKKHIKQIGITIKWDNLPDTENGFPEYFEGYDEDIRKSDYKCSVSFLSNGYWVPENTNDQQYFSLFTSVPLSDFDSKERINPLSVFNDIHTTMFQTDSSNKKESEFEYNKSTLSGFLKINFVAPKFAFGFKKYPDRLSHISMENAKKKESTPLPNPPISPIASDMQLSYNSTSEILLLQMQGLGSGIPKKFYHIQPWGYNDITDRSSSGKITLLPDYKNHGMLMIGLKNAKPNMTISILFNLLSDAVAEIDSDLPSFTWEYLSSNNWKRLPDLHLIADSTNGFLKSGIITVLLPEDINKENTILSNESHWIRISADGDLETICNVINVTAQAIKVDWRNNGNTFTHLKTGIPKGTIKEPEILLQGIKNILQITSSFGGKPFEGRVELKTRVGERLIHKNRAVTPWDYERLILEQFPDIYKVKCLPHINSNNVVCPGNILIAVIEKADMNQPRLDYDPMVNIGVLQEIKTFVSGLSSPFASIEVKNPVFEHVQVRCAVKIKVGLDAGYFINALNNDIIEYITPWQTNRKNEPGFGKHIKCSDVLSYIQSLEYIEYATDFSMLQITRDKQRHFHLIDTADNHYDNRGDEPGSESDRPLTMKILKPTYPWGILISVEKHVIQLINKKQEIQALITGIDELELGGSFIIE